MNEKEIKEKFEEIERRLDILEGKKIKKDSKKIKQKPLKGIPKGVISIIEEGFLDTPKDINKIKGELNRKGYFASREIIDRTIRRDFFQKKGILSRIKENKKWNYVVKK